MATVTITATEAFRQVRERAESIKNDDVHAFPIAASPGDYWAQGDVYITLLAGKPSNCKPSVFVAQLAPGTTQGSRHVLKGGRVEQYTMSAPTPLDGPVLHVQTETTVTHPEHGDVVLCPGWYGITYQRVRADELRRVRD